MRIARHFFQTYKEIIISVSLIVSAILLAVLIVLPTIQETFASLSLIRDLNAKIDILSNKVRTISALDENTLRDELTILTSAIPTDKSVPSIFATVDSVAAQSGVSVSDLSLMSFGSLATPSASRLSSEENKLGSFLLPLTVTIRGSHEQVKSFIQQIGHVRRLLRIENFDYTVRPDNLVQVRLSLDVFYIPLPSILSKIDQPLAQLSGDESDVFTKLSVFPWVARTAVLTRSSPIPGGKSNPFAR